MNGHISNPRHRLRPLPAAPLVVRRRYLAVVPRPMPAAPRRYLIVVPKPLPAAALVVRRRYLIVVPRPMPAAPRRYLVAGPKPLPAALLVVPRPLPAAQVLKCGVQAVARGAATLSQQKKNKSADVHRSGVKITGFICTVARLPSRRCTFGEF